MKCLEDKSLSYSFKTLIVIENMTAGYSFLQTETKHYFVYLVLDLAFLTSWLLTDMETPPQCFKLDESLCQAQHTPRRDVALV